MALLPKHEQKPVISELQEQQTSEYANHIFIMISANDKQSAKAAVHAVSQDLNTLIGVADLTSLANSASKKTNALYPFRFALLSDDVAKRLESGDYEEQLNSSLSNLFSPMRAGKTDPIQDPFFLYSDLLLNQKIDTQIKLEDGLLRLTNTGKISYLLVLELHQNPFNLATQAQVVPVLQSIKQKMNEQSISVSYSGLLLHAAKGAEQAKFEISTIGLGSILGIVIIILFVFRRVAPLIHILLPVIVGCLVAMAVTSLYFERVHLITIAFGAGLVGVAVDYSMHFVCESYLNDGSIVVRKLFPGLLLGLTSSVLAYGGLALTPFPGLQQIAVFSATGLIAAWLTVLLFLPLITTKNTLSNKESYLPTALVLNSYQEALPKLDQYPKTTGLFVTILVTTCFSVFFWATPQDSIRLLQTSPPSLLKEDQRVQQALGNNTNSAFLIVSGNSTENMLQNEELFRSKLDLLMQHGLLEGYQSISQSLPSLLRQQHNIGLVKKLYQAKLDTYAQVVGLSKQQKEAANRYLQDNSQTLSPETWSTLAANFQWSETLKPRSTGEYATMIRLQGSLSESTVKQLEDAAITNNNISYVDQVADISKTLANYRANIADWLLTAYGIITLLLALRYRLNVWRVMLPSVTGAIIALALAVFINGGYNIFNLIALMLVFGIGLDIGIFLQESEGGAHTWLAVSLSTFTSLLAFGLLALSKTPVLYHFGIIVLPGLLAIWLVSPLMQTRRLET
ncbi:MMPL family transporter [Marinomonas sp. 5E14-1]|uniref:MMPL family transporter n=1 Tax=Marinomonas sp. 5E14-1 TaxID=3153922 RepID=UPI003263651C